MIRSFLDKGLQELFETGKSKKINKSFHLRLLAKLDAINAAEEIEDLNLPGFYLHSLRSYQPPRYTIRVNESWRLTFEFSDGDAFNLKFENYH